MLKSSACVVFVILGLQSLWLPSTDGARILGIWPMAAPSHFFLAERLFVELAARGHDVTMIGYFPQKTPVKNYRDIALDLNTTRGKLESLFPKDAKFNLLDMGQMSPFTQQIMTTNIGNFVSYLLFENEDVMRLLEDKNEHFDLIIFEMFHTEILFGLAHKYNCPVVVLSTIGSSVWTNHLVGNPAPSTYIPDIFLSFSSDMSLYERVYNTVHNLLVEVYRKLFFFPQVNKKLHEIFKDAPDLDELMYKKTAMILLNSHPVLSDPKPHVPAMVEIGGFHVKDAKPLPKDLKDFMDKAKNGVILFSMGSNLKSTELDEDKRNAILQSFSKLKQQVIWKWEDENLPGKPSNVKIMKWCPQNDIMAHQNLRLFITHGGLLSTTEAIHHGVPVIGIPIFGDQKLNVAMVKRKGVGVGVNYQDLTEEKFTEALNEVLNNPKYRQNARKASELLRDQPVKPLDAAVFWIEHVIKHKGADHFRTGSMDLEWYQLYSLDIIALVILADIVLIVIFYIIIKKIIGKKSKANKKDMKKKKN